MKDNADLLGVGVITQRAMARDTGVTEDTIDLIKLAPGANATVVQNRLGDGDGEGLPGPHRGALNQEEPQAQEEPDQISARGADSRAASCWR